jgi:hypothetical protein
MFLCFELIAILLCVAILSIRLILLRYAFCKKGNETALSRRFPHFKERNYCYDAARLFPYLPV